MSSNLLWKPAGDGRSLDCDYGSALKDALREEFGTNQILIGPEHVPFLRGLKAAKVAGAAKLIEIVEEYGSIELWEVW